MLKVVITTMVLILTIEACLNKFPANFCNNGKANGRCDDPEFADNCELACLNCCDIVPYEPCFEAKARGECHNKLFRKCDKMCGHCVNK